jgi:hypothetical protein
MSTISWQLLTTEPSVRSHPVLIYPGGAREAFKKKSDPKYALFWAGTVIHILLALRSRASES